MFKFLKETVFDGYNKIKECFGLNIKKIDNDFLEKTLLEQNFMPDLVKILIKKIENDARDWKEVLKEELLAIFPSTENIFLDNNVVYILVGINGSGKTTSAIKLARQIKKNSVLLVPADTFRAAAKQQLQELSLQFDIDFFNHDYEQPAMVIFKAAEYLRGKQYSNVIIDTAGRIHQNDSLLRELIKTISTAKKQFIDKKIITLLVLDGMQGKNLLEQAKIFNNAIKIDGIILTKLDGEVKPGIIFSVAQCLKIPIAFMSVGQKNTDLILFNANDFVNSFFY